MATLTSTVTESITLNGSVRGSTNVCSITGVTQTSSDVKTCIASATTKIANFGLTPASAIVYSQFAYIDAIYVRVTNLSSTHTVECAFVGNGLESQCEDAETVNSYRVKLEPRQSTMIWDCSAGTLGSSAPPSYADALQNVSYAEIYNANEDNVDIEIFVASTEIEPR